ncbi:hypothetical protein D3C85_1257200 [compost metagenome]
MELIAAPVELLGDYNIAAHSGFNIPLLGDAVDGDAKVAIARAVNQKKVHDETTAVAEVTQHLVTDVHSWTLRGVATDDHGDGEIHWDVRIETQSGFRNIHGYANAAIYFVSCCGHLCSLARFVHEYANKDRGGSHERVTQKVSDRYADHVNWHQIFVRCLNASSMVSPKPL